MTIAKLVVAVPDFPKPGIVFRDISPLLANATEREDAFRQMAEPFKTQHIDLVAGLDARGFIFATSLSTALGAGLIMIRKPSKLPGETIRTEYKLEYGSNIFELSVGLVKPGQRVLIVDDVLATGGSAKAAIDLVIKAGGVVVGAVFLVELLDLNGYEALAKTYYSHNLPIYSLLKYRGDVLLDNEMTASSLPKSRQITKGPCYDCQGCSDKIEIAYARPLPLSNCQDWTPGGEIVLICHPSAQGIVDNILKTFPGKFVQSKVSWKRFPDTWPNIEFKAEDMTGRRVVFIGSLYDQANFIEQVSTSMILTRQLCKSVDIVFPYFPPGTMERVDKEGVLATAEPFAKMISSVPPGINGIASLRIFDIHSVVERFYFKDMVTPRNMTCIDMVIKEVDLITSSRYCLAFPDDGAYKRFRAILKDQNTPIIICSKMRKGKQRVVTISDRINWPSEESIKARPITDPMNYVLIMDDLVQTGGTLHECRQALVREGAVKVSAFVTHAVFPGNCYSRFLTNGDRAGFETFFTTDTIPEVAAKLAQDNMKPFKVLSIAPTLAHDIMKVHTMKWHNTPPMFDITLCSNNEDKHKAVTLSAQKYFPDAPIYGFGGCNSGVPEQPIGWDEIVKGARGRIEDYICRFSRSKSQDSKTPYHIIVAMENGIEYNKESDKWFDKGCIAVCVISFENGGGKMNKGTIRYASTQNVEVSKDIIKKLQETFEHNKDITVGKLMRDTDSSSNWHQCHGNKISRGYLLSEALDKVFASLVVLKKNKIHINSCTERT